jgi:pSer/pThr/pTyr-binding forkhead associated (FHA) protein
VDILVTHVTENARGQEQRDQRPVSGPPFDIGRGTQCQIHLPDARVALTHARITVTDTGGTIEALQGRVEVNGKQMDRAEQAHCRAGE